MRTDDFRPSDNVEDDREAQRIARRHAGRRRRPRYRHGHHYRADQLVLRHRSERAAQRRANSHRRRLATQQTVRLRRSRPGRRTTPTGSFVALVLGDTEDRWTEIFAASGRTYHPPKLRLFSGSEPTRLRLRAVGRWGRSIARAISASISTPRSSTTCRHKFGGCSNSKACQFSEAYVIAHEVGHHVQDELGILPRVTQAQQAASSKAEANALQVRIELQADCLAGVWANRAQQKHNFLDPGDVDQALQTAIRDRRRPAAEGDAGLCRARQLHPRHVRAAQALVPNGFNSGQVSGCDTLSASSLYDRVRRERELAACYVPRMAAVLLNCHFGETQAPVRRNIRPSSAQHSTSRGDCAWTDQHPSQRSRDLRHGGLHRRRILLRGAAPRFRRWFRRHRAARLSDGDRLRPDRDRHCRDGVAARLGAAHARRRHPRAALRTAPPVDRRRRADGGDRASMLNVEDHCLIVVVAFIGTINPSAGDVGMLVPLEHDHAGARRRRPRSHARCSRATA